MSATLARELTTRDIARERGVSPRTVRRWLRRLDRRTDGAVLIQNSDAKIRPPLRTTLGALRAADRRLVEVRQLALEEVAVELRRVSDPQIRAVRKKSVEVDTRVAELELQVRRLADLVVALLKEGQMGTSGAGEALPSK